jgi:hypothetical protein
VISLGTYAGYIFYREQIMIYFFTKVLISALVIAGVSELGRRLTPIAAILASLPLTSILAIIWLYHDTHDTTKIMDLSYGIFWAVLPSLLFFFILPIFLKGGIKFGLAMFLSSAIMMIGYALYVWGLRKLGIR